MLIEHPAFGGFADTITKEMLRGSHDDLSVDAARPRTCTGL
jgi:hypothetical protein